MATIERPSNRFRIIFYQQHIDPPLVEFRRINLDSAWPHIPSLDVVLMRNVLIYFYISTRRLILDRLRQVMQPDGYFVLGGAETTHNLDDNFLPMSFGQFSFLQLRGAVA